MLATIGVPAGLTFGGTLTIDPDLHVRLERVVPLGSTFVPCFWASDDSVDAIDAALRAEDDIESFRVVETVEGEALVHVEWTRDLAGLLTARQREVLRVAVDAGYYEVPRRSTIEDVAERLDLSAGTVSEHLQKVEACVLPGLLPGLGRPGSR